MSLFQEGTLEIDNPQSREEDEEVEEQRRRQEELTDLLAAGIHAFNYDESTINSSATSCEGVEQNCNDVRTKCSTNLSASFLNSAEQNYRDAKHEDQLKVLYEVRVREINSLRQELSQYQEEKSKEINILKNKVTLSEAEIRHLQVTLSNAESLLVEKTEIINNLKQDVTSKDQEIENLKKVVNQMKLEICTYASTINELQLKQSDNNPFSSGARKFKSEELQKVHQDQIIKLETLFQEQSKKTQILEKENVRLEEDIKRLMKIKKEIEEENNLTIMGLSKKLQNSQQQCKDLFLLGEAIKKESDHFKERIQQLEINKLNLSSDDFQIKKMDKDTLMVHLEKFKRMLLDKAIEMNTLKAKLKFYDSDMDELFEYRKILSKMYTCEVKLCSNTEHEELLIFMQRQLQSYEQAVEDRNNQIMNLNMVNKELQEKIEEMIQQTRTDIRNLSQKYSLPQLETMSNELKNAEETIHDLKKQLMEKHETSYQELTTKLEKACKHNEHLQQMAINEKQNFEEKLAEMKNDLKSMEEEKIKLEELIKSLKQSELKLAGENEKVKFELQKIYQKLGISETDIIESDADIHELNLLRSKCGQVHDQLQQVAMHLEKMSPKRAAYCDENMSVVLKMKKQILNYLKLLKTEDLQKTEIEDKLKEWDNMLSNFIDNLRSANNMMETSIKESELKDSVEDLTNAKTMLEGEKFALEYQLKSRSSELESAQREIRILMENKSILMKESEDNARLIQKLTDQVSNLEKGLKIVEENKIELEKQLENTQKQLNESKQETIKMHKELGEMNDNFVRKNLFKELKDVESELEQSRIDNKISGSEIFRKSIQAEILKAELILRERLEEENIKNMQKIEEQYRNVLTQKTEIYSKEKEKWKSQEMIYRKRFAAVLDECRKKMEALEKENINLITQINELIKEYKTYKIHITNDMEQYTKIIGKYKKNMETLNKEWKDLFGYYVSSYTNIEKRSQKKIKNLQKTINMSQTELNLIESIYDEKIKKIKSEWKSTNRI